MQSIRAIFFCPRISKNVSVPPLAHVVALEAFGDSAMQIPVYSFRVFSVFHRSEKPLVRKKIRQTTVR